MVSERLQDAVGPGKPNHPDDVRMVQTLLQQNAGLLGCNIRATGEFDSVTANAIYNFQRRIMRMVFATGVVEPRSETLWRLAEMHPPRLLAGAHGGIILAPLTGSRTLSEDDYQAAAEDLDCEVRVIKAIARVESSGDGFDVRGRPIIRYERHVFSSLTKHQYDIGHPFISSRMPGGYSIPERDQYARLQHAYALDADAALKATSWGLFQIMGKNHRESGYGTVEEFVRAMCSSAAVQLEAHVNFVKSKRDLHEAIQQRDWSTIAFFYNGSSYRINHYDTRLQRAYEQK